MIDHSSRIRDQGVDRKQAENMRNLPFIIVITIGLLLPVASGAVKPEFRRGEVRDRIHATQSDEDFVRALYQQLLNREPDPEGFKAWVEQLSSGSLTRMAVRKKFINSAEYREKMAGKIPRSTPGTVVQNPDGPVTIPGRPTQPGKEHPDGETLAPEQENAAYVNWLYRSVLRREPDESGFKANLEALNTGMFTREKLQKVFLESDEYRTGTANGEIPPFDPAKAGDFRNTLDDLLTGWAQTHEGPQDGLSQPQRFELVEKDSGAVEFETSGITHQDQDNTVGGDYWFFVMEGDYGQVRLQHTAGQTEDGTKRAVRYYIKLRPKFGESRMKIEVASDNLPDWHQWRVEWEPDRIAFFLDNRCIGEEKGLTIKPKHVMIGGYVGGRRNFKGNWRGFKAR